MGQIEGSMAAPAAVVPEAAQESVAATNGAAAASFLATGIGSLTMGLVTLLSAFGLFSPPDVLPFLGVGALTGKIALSVVVWLIAWVALYRRWRHRQVGFGGIGAATVILTGLGLLGTFLPFLLR